MEEKEISQKDIKWIEEQQQNSWNPEIIISGLSLAFILSFPHSIYSFVVFMVQEWGMDVLAGMLILMYLLLVVNLFKVFLITHLALRFAWASLLGMSYAFPKGIDQDKLFEHQRLSGYLSPQQMVLKLERICSMAFGIPLNMALVFIPLSIYLLLLVGIQVFLGLEFFVLYLIFMMTIIGLAIFGLVAKRMKFKISGNNYLHSISALYSSNLGKWRYNLIILMLFSFTIPLSVSDIKDFFQYFNQTNLDDNFLAWQREDWCYDDQRDRKDRFSRILLPSYEVSDKELNLYVAHYEEDSKFPQKLNDKFQITLDTLSWGTPKDNKDLYRIYVNDGLVATTCEWQKVKMPYSHQKAYKTCISLDGLERGVHELRVEKLIVVMPFMFDKSKPKLRKNWAVARFYYKKYDVTDTPL